MFQSVFLSSGKSSAYSLRSLAVSLTLIALPLTTPAYSTTANAALTASSQTTPKQGASQARKVLDRTAAVVGHKGGASASFTITGAKIGTTSGTIAIKGNKFRAITSKAMVWFNGKTQWTYMKQTNEVNISTPTQAQQMQMNPYTFISMYKSGYNLQLSTQGNSYKVHMKAQNGSRSVKEAYIIINKNTYSPTQVKMLQGNHWLTIRISNFRAKAQSDATFVFSSKDFPKAEIIDLR